MSNAQKIGLLKQEAGELSYRIKNAVYTLDRELRKPDPSPTRVAKLKAEIAIDKERLSYTRLRIAELEAQETED